MALTNQSNLVNSVGQREDLSDIIAVVDARETVLTSMLRKGKKPAGVYTEWQIDSYPTVSTSGTIDGSDVTTFENYGYTRQRIGNYIQQFRRVPSVSRLEENVANVAGLNNPDINGAAGATEFARSKAKATVQIKRDVEATFLSDNIAQNGSASPSGSGAAAVATQAYQTRGLGAWLTSAATSGNYGKVAITGDASTGGATGLLPTNSIFSGSLSGAFSEDVLRSLLQSRWNQTGRGGDLVAIVGANIKNAVTDFSRYLPAKTIAGGSSTSVRFYNDEIGDKSIESAVDIYSGDYGNVELFLSAFIGVSSGTANANRGYILDPEYIEMRTLTAPYFTELPDLGAGRRGIVETICTLVPTNPLAHIQIAATA